ncbi:acyl-CoA synthetase short-chain family member 3, mitochondrial-like isoform X2 [Lytechinus variegatus]|uniref:acyl-CoA synthetase short-chain family member 3, mitochondrial-like isoform X2 n=1 Tax=Lytechinus variegatus TaxID=7654 RepID=UPI001BB13CEE|nr:acyl-CoA synthetase short-chain family member 3, mitochondrial-like isoform X2 [Lytechinus variegatus]
MAAAKLSSKLGLRLFATNYGSASCKTIMGLRNFRKIVPGAQTYFTNSRNHQKSRPTTTAQSTYPQVFADSIAQPEEFWAEQAERVVWFKKWDKVMDLSQSPATNWFVGGELNMCYNAVDRHVDEGYGDQDAIIHDSPVTGTVTKITYKELQEEVSKFATALVNSGVKYGDRVLIYMPMIPQAVMAMLACARIGAIHVLVFGGFASKELSVRIDHVKPKVVVSASVGVEPGRIVDYKNLLDNAIDMCETKPKACIIYNRPNFESANLIPGRDFSWTELVSSVKGHDCVPVKATDALYVLHTSGATGTPKAPMRPTGGYVVTLYWTMKHLYGMEPGEVWWAASDLGWIVGHSYICYAPLLHRNPTIIYEGKPVGTPDPGAFFRVLNQHDVVSMFTAPTALRAIIKEDPEAVLAKKYSRDKFRILYVAGEIFDRESLHWCRDVFNVPIIDHWWQTETGWAMTHTAVGLGEDLYPRHGVTGKPVPGWDVRVLDEMGQEAPRGELGNICIKLPLPPAAFTTLWGSHERYIKTYFEKYPGYYDTMDAGVHSEDGYIAIQARVDDVISVAGHRIAASAIEEAMVEQGDIVECCTIPVNDKLKGQVPVGLCVLKKNVDKPEKQIVDEVIAIVRSNVGPVAFFKRAVIVSKLPRTRSGKITRGVLAKMVNGEQFNIPPTIEDATAYEVVKTALVAEGIMKE